MNSKDNVPLASSSGLGSGNVYDRQFAQQIGKISKPGSAPRSDHSEGSNRGGVGVGVGVMIAIVYCIVRFGLMTGSHSDSTTYHAPPSLMAPPERSLLLEDIAAQQQAMEWQLFGLNKEDIPCPGGLCYRILRESQGHEANPGQRIFALLDPIGRLLIIRLAGQHEVDDGDKDSLCRTLNMLLSRRDFYEPRFFPNLPAFGPLLPGLAAEKQGELLTQNRTLLAAAYPKQIIPTPGGAGLTRQQQLRWRQRALADLNQARKEFDQQKP